MRKATIALLVLLAGCATPGEVRQDGVRADFTLRQPPAEAIKCMTRNAEEYRGWYIVQSRSDGVVVRNSETTIAVADVRAAGAGSTVTVWRHRMMGGVSDLPEAMTKGC